jgi:uncharacterized membrane protein
LIKFYKKSILLFFGIVRKRDGKIKVKQAVHLMGTGIVGGAFWGILIGMFALFILIAKWVEDNVLEKLKKFKATIIRTPLSNEDELNLKATYGADE